MIPSLKGWPTKAKEAPSPHEVTLAPLDTNPVFQNLGGRKYQTIVFKLVSNMHVTADEKTSFFDIIKVKSFRTFHATN